MNRNYNVVSKTLDDYTTTYDITDGDTEFIFETSMYGNFYVSVIAGEFEYPLSTTVGTDFAGGLDSTVELYESEDGINKQPVSGASTFLIDAAQKKGGWKAADFEARYCHLIITQNTSTDGTLRIIYTYKNQGGL